MKSHVLTALVETVTDVLFKSPAYVTLKLREPGDTLVNAGRAHAAVLVLPAPESATAAQPATGAPLMLKLAVPVGVTPVMVAVSTAASPPTKVPTGTAGADE